MTSASATRGSFLKHLNVHRTPHVVVTAEDDDFDEVFIQQLSAEGFNVRYLALGKDSEARFADKIHALANHMTGVSEQYAIVAFGDAAGAVLETHTKSSPRLNAIIAYYPSTIPDPSKTSFPINTLVLVHLADGVIGVRKNQEVLGIQGKRRTVRKRIDGGLGLGGQLNLRYRSYRYFDVEAGFSEHDLDCFDARAEDLAWSRTLSTLREAFGIKVDLETIRDQHVDDVRKNIGRALEVTSAQAKVLYGPTMTGASSPKDLHRFYTEFFDPSPSDLKARLLSRTVGTNRIVDEIHLSFKHDREIHWLLPGIPATGKQVQIILVSIVCIKGGIIAHERVYWDQASVLLQIGLLDYKNIPQSFKKQGVHELPVMGKESVEATLGGSREMNELIEDW